MEVASEECKTIIDDSLTKKSKSGTRFHDLGAINIYLQYMTKFGAKELMLHLKRCESNLFKTPALKRGELEK